MYEYVGSRPSVLVDPFGLNSTDDEEETEADKVIKRTKKIAKEVIKIAKAIKAGKRDADIRPSIKTISGQGTQILTAAIAALAEFTPETKCGEWYKESYIAIATASMNCDASKCAIVSQGNSRQAGLHQDCLEILLKQFKTYPQRHALRTQFHALVNGIEKECRSMVKAKIKAGCVAPKCFTGPGL